MASRFTRPNVSVRLGKTGEHGFGILGFQPRPLRPVADDDLAALPRHPQEGLDVLLDGNPSNISGERALQVQKVLRGGFEQIGVDPPPPGGKVLKPAGRQFLAHRDGAHHATCRGPMETIQHPIRKAHRDREARPQVLGELGVVGRREAQPQLQAMAAGAESERTLGGDMQGLRIEFADFLAHQTGRQQREADFRIGRTGNAAKILGREHPHVVAEAAQPLTRLSQRSDHAVGLGKPGIGDDHDSHAWRRSHVCMTNV
jgi:hypothetical protein